MESDDDKSNKTEEPTEQKLRKAREKGDVPSSQETGSMMVVFALFVIVIFIMPQITGGFVQVSRNFIELAGQNGIVTSDKSSLSVGLALFNLITTLSIKVAPLFFALIVAAVIGILLQGETVVALDRIKPKPEKISPIGGLKKMFSIDRVVDFSKNVIKVFAVAIIAFVVAKAAIQKIWMTQGFITESILSYISEATTQLLLFTSIFLAPIAIFDIVWKRMQWIKKQRMSIQEIKDEHKDIEGDPKIKAQRTQIRRKRASQRITTSVPTADVIITNPTHFAVALKYELGVDTAPICVAKGVDVMAAQIRHLADENEIPIIENRPLARSLHASVEVDDQIPLEHWQVVAEIIGYVMDLRRNIRREPPAGSILRLDADDN